MVRFHSAGLDTQARPLRGAPLPTKTAAGRWLSRLGRATGPAHNASALTDRGQRRTISGKGARRVTARP